VSEIYHLLMLFPRPSVGEIVRILMKLFFLNWRCQARQRSLSKRARDYQSGHLNKILTQICSDQCGVGEQREITPTHDTGGSRKFTGFDKPQNLRWSRPSPVCGPQVGWHISISFSCGRVRARLRTSFLSLSRLFLLPTWQS